MTTPLDTVSRFLAAMAVADYDHAMTLIDDACVYANPGVLPTVTGPAAMRALLEPFFAPTLENDLQILNSAVSGDLLFAERLDRHRLETGWVDLPVTGVFEVKDGRIIRWTDYFNGATITDVWPR